MSNILTSLHGNLVGLDADGALVVPGGVKAGAHGKQLDQPSANKAVFFDDFLGDIVIDQWNALEGSDSLTSAGAILSGGIGGVYRMTTGDVTGVTATEALANVEQLTQALQWQASNGGLVMQARLKLSSILTGYAFIGFTDNAAAAELPVVSAASANTITTNASDAVGFMYDPRMSTDDWWLVGVAGDTDATAQDSGVAPTAAEYQTFRVEVSATGVATFFINGLQVGTAMSGAVTAATDLTPTVAVTKIAADTTSINGDLDYVYVAMDRGADDGAV